MLPREIVKLRACEIAGTCIFLFIFAFSKLSRKAIKLHEEEHFTLVIEKWVTCAPCPPVQAQSGRGIRLR